jgi:hypothetical protein
MTKQVPVAFAVWNLLHTVSPSNLSLFVGHTDRNVVTAVLINSTLLIRNMLLLFLFYIITNLRQNSQLIRRCCLVLQVQWGRKSVSLSICLYYRAYVVGKWRVNVEEWWNYTEKRKYKYSRKENTVPVPICLPHTLQVSARIKPGPLRM